MDSAGRLDGSYDFKWNLAHLHVVPSGVVVMYDWLYCAIFVIIAGYHNLLGGVLYITWIWIGRKLLLACALFLLVGVTISDWGLVTGCLFASYLTCILAACDIGKSDLTCLAHSNFTGNGKSQPKVVFLCSIKGRHLSWLDSLALCNKPLTSWRYLSTRPFNCW